LICISIATTNYIDMEAFYLDWMTHPSYWFQQSDVTDTYLRDTYWDLLDEHESEKDNPLASLIVHDQLIRHIERHCASQHIILYHLEKALEIHTSMKGKYTLNCLEWCFWGLPVRHSGNANQICALLKEGWEKLQGAVGTDEDVTYLRKFITASYQRMPMNQIAFLSYHVGDRDTRFKKLMPFQKILDYFPEHAPAGGSPLLESVFAHFLKKQGCGRVLVSLSGGVDSMLCSYILHRLEIPMVALHINYCNRDDLERNFVKEWCRYLGIPLFIRDLREIQRKPCMEQEMRGIYELYTRNVRFECYKTITRNVVILGHNQDDCFENILTNLCHQHKYENLKGMLDVQTVEGVTFGRPLLDVSKATIYEEARRIGIPYLKDSTPKWSQRGQIRDTVRPVLEQWDKRMTGALFELSNVLEENEMYKAHIVQDLIGRTVLENGIKRIALPEIAFGKSVWKAYLKQIGVTIKQKSLDNFINILAGTKEFKCILSKECLVEVSSGSEGLIITFKHPS